MLQNWKGIWVSAGIHLLLEPSVWGKKGRESWSRIYSSQLHRTRFSPHSCLESKAQGIHIHLHIHTLGLIQWIFSFPCYTHTPILQKEITPDSKPASDPFHQKGHLEEDHSIGNQSCIHPPLAKCMQHHHHL